MKTVKPCGCSHEETGPSTRIRFCMEHGRHLRSLPNGDIVLPAKMAPGATVTLTVEPSRKPS